MSELWADYMWGDLLLTKFTFAIEEIVVQEFSLYASNSEEAFELVKQKYRTEFMLEPGEATFKQMVLMEPSDETAEWSMF